MSSFEHEMMLVGSLVYGQSTGLVAYHNPPTYRAFKFLGQKGDRVTVSVSSINGDAVAWLLADDFSVIAKNDDADATTLDSLIYATLPGNNNPNILNYYIAFRDYDYHDAGFVVRLGKEFTRPLLTALKAGSTRRLKPNFTLTF